MVTSDTDSTLALIRDQATRLLGNAATPEHLKALLDNSPGFDQTLWHSAAEQGWPAIALAEEQGGIGLGWRGLCELMQVLGQHTGSLPLATSALTAYALASSENTDAAGQYLASLAAGEISACVAFAEPGDAGTGIPAQRCRLIDGRLNGAKAVTPFAAVADIALVCAQDGQHTQCLLVPLAQPGVTREPVNVLDNARAAAALVFSDAHCYPLAGTLPCQALLCLYALATAFEQIGGAEAAMTMARNYALERTAFGQPIGRFQAIKHKIADMYWRTEIARGCAIDALDALEQQTPDWQSLCAMARIAATDAYEFASRENIQVHAGIGVTWEAMPHHYYRRSRSLALEVGSLQSWRNLLLDATGIVA
jgi:alkylation response protein AidB-like acyl-CoA dehydrogenase